MTEPFDRSYAPGPKSFDFDINEISITKPRGHGGGLLGALLHQPAGDHRQLDVEVRAPELAGGLRSAKIGVQIGTTSLDATNSVIKPSSQPDVFNTSNDVVAAFKIQHVNAIVVDWPRRSS